MKLALCIIALAAGTSALTVNFDAFEAWKSTHGKAYTGAEHEQRKAVWLANLAKVEVHNALNETWHMEMNEFADLTEAEFASLYASIEATNSEWLSEVCSPARECKFVRQPPSPILQPPSPRAHHTRRNLA